MSNHTNKPLRAVITGANGFVGSHLAEALISKGFEVHCILRKSSNTQWLDGKNVTINNCGLSSVKALKAAFLGADYVFHIAGVVKADSYEGFYDGNVVPTQKVLEAALGAPNLKRILITSSLAATGSNAVGQPSTEAMPCAPVSDYGRSKKAQEELCHTYAKSLSISIVRPPAVYGERDTEVLLFFKSIQKGVFPSVGLGAPQTLSLVHVRDLVEGMIAVATHPAGVGKTYFLGSNPAEYTWEQVAAQIGLTLNKKFMRIKIPIFAIHGLAIAAEAASFFSKIKPSLNRKKVAEIIQPSWACSSQKAMQEVGYQPTISLQKGVTDTINWYKAQGWL